MHQNTFGGKLGELIRSLRPPSRNGGAYFSGEGGKGKEGREGAYL